MGQWVSGYTPPPPTLTCAHEVVPVQGQPEEAGQDGQEGPHSREGLGEPGALRAEAGKGPRAHDPVGVGAQDVVLTGAEIRSLHQLGGAGGVGTQTQSERRWLRALQSVLRARASGDDSL